VFFCMLGRSFYSSLTVLKPICTYLFMIKMLILLTWLNVVRGAFNMSRSTEIETLSQVSIGSLILLD
jgi:hypothetical protein